MSLREDDVEVSREVLCMLLQPYTRDDNSPGDVTRGRRAASVCVCVCVCAKKPQKLTKIV